MQGTEKEPKKADVHLLCLPIGHLPAVVQLLLLTAATFGIFMLYSYWQEFVFTSKAFHHGWFMTVIQMGTYAVLAGGAMLRTGGTRSAPWSTYFMLAFLHGASTGLSNSSLQYLNYPTQIVFKSSKILPTLFVAVCVLGKSFSALEVVGAGAVSGGLALFTLADVAVSPVWRIEGVVLICLAVLCDAFLGNLQEKAMKQYAIPQQELVFFEYSIGVMGALVFCVASGEFVDAVRVCAEEPSLYLYMLLFSVSGYIGLYVVLTLVKQFGAVLAVTVTSLRKMVSMVVSFVFFPKPFVLGYLWGAALVFAGIAATTVAKQQKKREAEALLKAGDAPR